MPPAPRTKPGRPNLIEHHPRRAEIELARIAGGTLQEVADRFGVPRSSLHRHMTKMPVEEYGRLAAVASALAEQQAALLRVAAIAIAAGPSCSPSFAHGAAQ
ncbi:helix-turn-helix domain-containing protein [Methylobacterium sp. AMS5]|uniref:helix-turn-helix domain-containing protein n=1 Tax=Methylobacterium sp. AMS5 TaxID=925818 RepID=UPI00074F965B|nr:hypothetical protein Y590_25960 [Methylobacterium sp. AMS5]